MKRMLSKGIGASVASFALLLALGGCGNAAQSGDAADVGGSSGDAALVSTITDYSKASIEEGLNLANNADQEWTYSADANAWTLSTVLAVANPEIPDEQGVSVCVPGAYVKGIDTNGDGTADITAETASGAVKGSLVIDYDAKVTSTNGQVYTAATAPVIVNTGAAGYSEQSNRTASSEYAAEGYVNVSCGNRGKQSAVTDESGATVYTGDAPSCLVDQKNAVRYVKYNILLGNLPGSVDYFVSTGGSGGGAHAAMLAATSNNPDYYAYEAAAGAVGVYANEDGTYSTTVTVNGKEVELSDGMWGCIAYSAITPLAIGDTTMAFEYNLDADYSFNTSFQKQLAEYLSAEYMNYINAQNLAVDEAKVGLDVNGDGAIEGTVALSIEYDAEKYADTNGYGGTYLNLYLAEFEQNLESYLANLDYGTDWTWFDANGNALSDEDVANMTTADKAQAFIEGRYAKGSSDSGMGGGPGGNGGPGGEMGGTPPDGGPNGNSSTGAPNGTPPDGAPNGTPPDGGPGDGQMPGGNSSSGNTSSSDANASSGAPSGAPSGSPNASSSDASTEKAGTPDAGTTQSSSSGKDSSNYASYSEMVAAYASDIAQIEAGDAYGNNIVELYNPLNYIGAEGTDNPTWTRVVMGASEGDMSMFASLNMELAWLNSGTDAVIEWQWDGGHVPSEILGDSLALYVDEMYGKYVEGAVDVEKPAAEKQTTNGDATEATGTDISSWVTYSDGKATFSLADAASYRTSGAAKAIPGFDTIDYGQEDYVFGSSTADARHWDKHVLQAFQEHADTLEALFNAS